MIKSKFCATLPISCGGSRPSWGQVGDVESHPGEGTVVTRAGLDTLRNGLIIVLGGSWHATSWALEAVLSIKYLVAAAHLILLQQEACVGPRQGEAGLGVGRVRGAGGAHHLHLLPTHGSLTLSNTNRNGGKF